MISNLKELVDTILTQSSGKNFSISTVVQALSDKTSHYGHLYDEILNVSNEQPDDITDLDSWASEIDKLAITPGTDLSQYWVDNIYQSDIDKNKAIILPSGDIIKVSNVLAAYVASSYKGLETVNVTTKNGKSLSLDNVSDQIFSVVSSSTAVQAAIESFSDAGSSATDRLMKYNTIMESSSLDLNKLDSSLDTYLKNIILSEGISISEASVEVLKIVTSHSFSKKSDDEAVVLVTTDGSYTGVTPAIAFLNSVNIDFQLNWLGGAWNGIVATGNFIVAGFLAIGHGLVNLFDNHISTAFISADINVETSKNPDIIMDVPYFQFKTEWVPGELTFPWDRFNAFFSDGANYFHENLSSSTPALDLGDYLNNRGLNIVDDDDAILLACLTSENTFSFDLGFIYFRISYSLPHNMLYFQAFLRPTDPVVYDLLPKLKLVGSNYESLEHSIMGHLESIFNPHLMTFDYVNSLTDKKIFDGLCASRLRLEYFISLVRMSVIESTDIDPLLTSTVINKLFVDDLNSKYDFPFIKVASDDSETMMMGFSGHNNETFGNDNTSPVLMESLNMIYYTKVPSTGSKGSEPNNTDFLKVATYVYGAGIGIITDLTWTPQVCFLLQTFIGKIIINKSETLPYIRWFPELNVNNNFMVRFPYACNKMLPPRNILISTDRQNGVRFRNLILSVIAISATIYFGPKLLRWRKGIKKEYITTQNSLAYAEFDMGEQMYKYGFDSSAASLSYQHYRIVRKRARKLGLVAKLLGVSGITGTGLIATSAFNDQKSLSIIARAIDENIEV